MSPEHARTDEQNPQKILVFQQQGSGEAKIAGLRRYGGSRFQVRVHSIDEPLPPLLDDTDGYLPERIQADLVLDFLKHPDLSEDLAKRCADQGIPVVASGKKIKGPRIYIPPT
ncbi:protein of unknown function [Desulfacinum hydrothermale DSM 13146]|uniref:Uncharacterized protein n=2 Tax=Desulfacinum hydrothermale TaxID=109258 RepID=A0A1W1XVN0_9BACT|nr:protein of unknown function [Desulfacinum hydrothermale DSM 13146]